MMSRQRFPCRDRDGHDKRLGVTPFMLQQIWPWQGFLCRDKAFQVTTEFGQGQEFLCRDRIFLCCDRVWPWIGFLCRDEVFLHRDRVWPRQGILGRDKLFSCRDRVWGKAKRVYVATENLMSR